MSVVRDPQQTSPLQFRFARPPVIVQCSNHISGTTFDVLPALWAAQQG
jgi:hypothetical protein